MSRDDSSGGSTNESPRFWIGPGGDALLEPVGRKIPNSLLKLTPPLSSLLLFFPSSPSPFSLPSPYPSTPPLLYHVLQGSRHRRSRASPPRSSRPVNPQLTSLLRFFFQATLSVAQAPNGTSICDYYTAALTGNNTGANQMVCVALPLLPDLGPRGSTPPDPRGWTPPDP